jgi:hypothetical protein
MRDSLVPEPALEPRRHVRSGSSSDGASWDGLPADLGLGLRCSAVSRQGRWISRLP